MRKLKDIPFRRIMLKIGSVLKETFSRKNWFILAISGACYVVLALLGMIIFWFFNSVYTSDLLDGVKENDIIGVSEVQQSKETPKKVGPPFVSVNFDTLKETNEDTVAWLRVGAVNLDIPIVQTVDNDYYLTHDIKKQTNSLGWVFADARSNMEYLGDNTVLYGHNAASREMFGSLKGILDTDPEKKKQNEIIQLTTETQEMVFEITSVYVTDYEDWKYVRTYFPEQEDKEAFVKRMKDKNESKVFGKDHVSTSDRFLTFSTCYGPAGTTKRLVVHAKMTDMREVDGTAVTEEDWAE